MNDRFRREVYQSFEQRADAGMDLVDALTSAPTVNSPVELSEAGLFRRGFSSVYDFLKSGRIVLPRLRRLLFRHQPAQAETIAGYEVYALDCTGDPAPEAKTLPDRGQSKKGRHAPLEVGHTYSWLVRLVARGTSWCMPLDIERVSTESSDSQVGAQQVAALAQHNHRPKVVVADSLYCNATFLAIFLTIQFVYALVRVAVTGFCMKNRQNESRDNEAALVSMAPSSNSLHQAGPLTGPKLVSCWANRCACWLGQTFTSTSYLSWLAWYSPSSFSKQMVRLASSVPSICSGLVPPRWLWLTWLACTCGVLPLSICSDFSNNTWG